MTASDTRHLWFGAPTRPLSGWLTVPGGGRARGGVLLCPPMGEEGRSSYRTFRDLAEALGRAGFAALRFDYDGTGDSAGLQDDPERVAAWLDSIAHARRLLAETGVPRVDVVGLRLGATLAAVQAQAGDPADSLVLWEPCATGRSFLREGEALHRLGGHTPADDGLRHTPGFQYDAATAAGLRTLSLSALPPGPIADRVLLLSRADRSTDPRLLARLHGPEITQETVDDLGALLDEAPSDVTVPAASIARIVDWLETHAGPDAAVRLPQSHDYNVDGVREHVRTLGTAGLCAIATEPDTPRADGHPQPWVVLVNVAIEHRIGPGRRWVEWSRQWASLGCRTVRIELSGVGDSGVHPGSERGEIFAPGWITDVRDVVRELAADGSPVVMMGLCSGAYSAFEAAMWEPVRAVFAVNPRLTLYAAAKGEPVHTTQRRAATYPARPIARLARKHRLLAGGLWRIWRQFAIRHAPYRFLHAVHRRGTRVEVIACPEDAQHFTEIPAWWPALVRDRRQGLVLESVSELDHSMLTKSAQDFVQARATAFVRRYGVSA